MVVMVDIRACIVIDDLINPTRVGLTVPDIFIKGCCEIAYMLT